MGLAMPRLDRERVAGVVSEVTRVMCDTVFVPGDPLERGESLYRRLTMISMRGDPNITVVLAVDDQGGCALASTFFSCAPRDVTQSMIDDVVAELLNMLAGQISGVLSYSYSLGLPHRTTLGELNREDVEFGQAILLRSEGKVDLGLWLLEERPLSAHRRAEAADRH
jgi:hypothetical protein